MGSFDVIVVGVGTFGAAACAELAARGRRVLGIDAFDPPHARGSHHGRSRMFRLAYFEHPDYVPLLVRSFDLWKRLEADAGRRLFHVTGGLYCGRPECDAVARAAASAAAHNLDHEVLTRAEIRRRFPQFSLPESFVALFEPRAGFVEPEAAVESFIALARARGGVVRTREPVREWAADGAGVRVTTEHGRYRAERLIFTAGPWTGALVPTLAPVLRVSRQVVGWVRPLRPEPFELGRFPCWAVEDAGALHYGFPMMPGHAAMKLAAHVPGPTADPDAPAAPCPADEASFRAALARFLPQANGPLHCMETCLYTNSPDGHFIIDRAPADDSGRVLVACGFSGHGFKFAPVIGEALADLVCDGRTPLPIGFLSAARLKGPA